LIGCLRRREIADESQSPLSNSVLTRLCSSEQGVVMDLFTLTFFGLALVLIGSLWSRVSERRSAKRPTNAGPLRAQEASGSVQQAGSALTEWTRIQPTRNFGTGVRAASAHVAPIQGYASSAASFDRARPGAPSARRGERPPVITSP
jgi:hypothetical protein